MAGKGVIDLSRLPDSGQLRRPKRQLGFHRLAQAAAFFVVRSKTSAKWRCIESRPVDNLSGIEADRIIRLAVPKSRARYPGRLRRVTYPSR
jgi:hypothetical protein